MSDSGDSANKNRSDESLKPNRSTFGQRNLILMVLVGDFYTACLCTIKKMRALIRNKYENDSVDETAHARPRLFVSPIL